MKLEILGVHPVPESEEPCHLVEWRISDYDGPFRVTCITQPIPGEGEDHWQAPYDEYVLANDGAAGESVFGPFDVAGSARFCFFWHYLDLESPFQTPAGLLLLPSTTARPRRLEFVEYEAP